MEWFCAIRAAKQKVLQEKHPDWHSDKVCYGYSYTMIVAALCHTLTHIQVKENLSNDFIKCGYMQKTPSGTIKVGHHLF